jgi:nitronate monooxygenase
MLETRFTRAYGLRFPIVGATMANHTSAGLAAAVSEAGGLGGFGVNNAGGADWMREQIHAVRARTDRPFVVGFITAFIDASFASSFDVCLEERVPLILLSFGDPRPYAVRAKAAGIDVACQVQTLEGARWALEAGARFIVAQGNEAGGHSGYLNTLPCLSMVLEIAGDTPVLAAGGIADGRSLAAVLAAGGEGAMVGTALLATPEATEMPDAYKQLIVASDGEDTVFTEVYDIVGGRPWPKGIGERVRRNALVESWTGRERELRGKLDEVRSELQAGQSRRDPQVASVLMGQSAGFIRAVRPAAEVIETLCADAETVLRRRVKDLALGS